MSLLYYNSLHIVLMAHRQWIPVARALWYSLKATHLMHTWGCLCRNAWVAMQVKIGCGHLFTLLIQQSKLHNIWFLNMEYPSHKITWRMWFQLARMLLCARTFTGMKVISQSVSLCVGLLANQHGSKWYRNYVRN